jgi:serine O-acetyltransferase
MKNEPSQQNFTFFQLVRGDLKVMMESASTNKVKILLTFLMKLVFYTRFQAILLFRLSQLFYRARLTPFAYLLQSYILIISGAELHPAAKIGPGFLIVHSSGIVIGDQAVVGSFFRCFHGITIGDSGKGDGQPVIGDYFTAYAGSKILGGITIGDHAAAGANAVVMIDIPSHGVAAGIPAKIVKIRSA